MTAVSITGLVNPNTGLLQGSYSLVNAAYLLGANRSSPARFPMEMCYPRPDSETSPYAYHRIWQTGEPMHIPVRPMFGAFPYSYRILSSSHTGWSIGEFLVPDSNGDLVVNPAYGTLSTDSAQAGANEINVGCWGADGSFIPCRISIDVGEHGFYAGETDTGAGDGSSPNDCMDFITAYGSGETLSPAKNKVFFVRGGTYTLTDGMVEGTEKPRSVIGYRDEWPVISSSTITTRINRKSSDIMFTGCILDGWGDAATFQTYGSYFERQSVWRCKIRNAYGRFTEGTPDTNPANNEAGWFTDRASGIKRPHFLFSEIEFIDCNGVSAFDWYEVEGLAERHIWTSSLPELKEPVWYPKAGDRVDMRLLYFDNTAIAFESGVLGVINIGNNEQYTEASSHVRFCFVRTASGANGIGSNTSINASSVDNWMDHVTLIGGNFNAFNYGDDDQVYVDRFVIQNPTGTVIDHEANGGATVTNTLGATSGLVDANGRLLNPANVGLYGYHIRAAE